MGTRRECVSVRFPSEIIELNKRGRGEKGKGEIVIAKGRTSRRVNIYIFFWRFINNIGTKCLQFSKYRPWASTHFFYRLSRARYTLKDNTHLVTSAYDSADCPPACLSNSWVSAAFLFEFCVEFDRPTLFASTMNFHCMSWRGLKTEVH